MGIDFVRKCAPRFQRSWDRNRAELAQPSLLNLEATLQEQTYRAVAGDGFAFTPGDNLVVHLDAERVVLCKQVAVVGIIHQPTQNLLRVLASANGVAVARVQKTWVDGSAADISVY